MQGFNYQLAFRAFVDAVQHLIPRTQGTQFLNVQHAPPGGIQIQGKFYPGGQFIPDDVLEAASDDELAELLYYHEHGQDSDAAESQEQPHHVTPNVETAQEPAVAAATEKPGIALAKAIASKFDRNEPIDAKAVFAVADGIHGGTRAEGTYHQSQAYDALETGFNLHLRGKTDPTADLADAQAQAAGVAAQIANLPTQTNRSGNKESFQQFSTPPHYAFAAAWVANIQPGEVVLEPSAGTGCLAIQAENAGGVVYANELDPERADYLKHLFGDDKVHVENAEQISAILPGKGVPAPSVVVMNPPFSQTAGRMGDKKELLTGAKHIEEAGMMLAPGGRLVSIVGRGMTPESPTYKAWFRRMAERGFALRANVGVSGKEYKKYGTQFDSRILVFDRTAPDGQAVVSGDAQDISDLMAKLEGVRNGRSQTGQATQPIAGEPAGPATPPESATPTQPASDAPAATGESSPGRNGAIGVGGTGIPAVAGEGSDKRDGVPSGRHGGVSEPSGVGGPDSTPGGSPGSPPAKAPTGRGGRSRAAAGRKSVEQLEQDVPRLRPAAPIGIKVIDGTRPQVKKPDDGDGESDALFETYMPARLAIPGAHAHPSALVESSAMSAIPPPSPTYQPWLSPDVVEQGLITAPALESVVYAGQAHQQFLPAAEGEPAYRRGFFIGDGTGTGKGRQVAGIIADNLNQGRKKHVWVSEKQTLLEDATRDWKDIGQDPKAMFHFDKLRKAAAPPDEGVCFVTYDTLKGRPKDPAEPSNLDGLVKWLGADFDGVIAFDESHGMRNAKGVQAGRGMTKPSLKALSGLALQKALPKARVVYISATGATEVSNLAYAERLGLWGRGAAFANKDEFIDQMDRGGVAAMECVAQNLKAMGGYVARSLSYDDGTPTGRVTYNRLTHQLTPEQHDQYDSLAVGWQNVLQNIDKALEAAAPRDNKGNAKISSHAKSAALSQFWGAQQRFFNQLMTSMQTPSVINSIEQDIKDGKSPVVQLVNTMEAAMKRAISRREEGEELEDLDVSPREILMQYLESSFPVHRYETFKDDDGNEQSRVAIDGAGNPVIDPEAKRLRDEMLDGIGAFKIPESPLDMILNHFGHENVAEATGRTQRVIDKDQDDGSRRKVKDRRNPATANAVETRAFQDGKKKILVFSDAGGTGRSYHANRNDKNQDQRVHYLLQAGWRADKAIQGLGRTHRTNQASAPTYRLVEIDAVRAQRRFITTIARRLDQLGALTRGQRQAGSAGLFKAADNLESPEAVEALNHFFEDMRSGSIDGLDSKDIMTQMGYYNERDEDRRRNEGKEPKKFETPPMSQFLNRLLSLKVGTQASVFDAFDERLQQTVEQAVREGTLDVGVENYPANRITPKGENVVFRDPSTGAEARHVVVTAHIKSERKTLAEVNAQGREPLYYVRERESGNVRAVYAWKDRTDPKTGRVEEQVKVQGPGGAKFLRPWDANPDSYGSRYEKITKEAAEQAWKEEYEKISPTRETEQHFIAGAFLPIWDRLPGDKPKIFRLKLDNGQTFVGRHIPPKKVEETLKKLGVSHVKAATDFGDLHRRLKGGEVRVGLANGWKVRPARVQGEQRIEIVGPSQFHFMELEKDGVFRERINYETRFFIPAGNEGVDVIRRILETRPVSEESELR